MSYFSANIRENTKKDMHNVVLSISSQLDLCIREMDRLSKSVTFNNNIINSLLSIYGQTYDSINSLQFNTVSRTIYDNLFSIAEPVTDIDRICVFSDQNVYFSNKPFDEESQEIRMRMLARNKPAYMSAENKFYMIEPHKDEWVSSTNNNIVFSLQRIIKSVYGERAIGLVEVQSKYEVISNICNMNEIGLGQIIILDNQKSLIYPFELVTILDQEFYAEWYKKNKFITKSESVTRIYDKKRELWTMVVSKYSDYTKWTVLYVLPEEEFLKPINRITKVIIGIGIIGVSLSFVIAYIIVTHIYKPLRMLRKKVEDFDYQNFDINDNEKMLDIQETDAEIAVLNNTFDVMAIKLKKSVEEKLQTKQEIEKAYYKILQSQVSPHFFYNTLSSISIIGEELNDDRIPDICEKLTDMLKYTSDFRYDYVKIDKEIKNVSNYLGVLKYRFEHRLVYSVRIDQGMYKLIIPRMTLQPFVENSLKHGLSGVDKPIKININGKITDQGWEIIIKDNGKGIEQKNIEKIYNAINNYNKENTEIDSMKKNEVEGLGILNTYMRLKIFFGDKLYFKINSSLQKGTEIIIRVKN